MLQKEIFSDEHAPVFRVLMIYEDFESGKKAKRTADKLAANLATCEIENQMWKFDVLNLPRLREMATRDALEADVVIISCRGDHPVPATLQVWLESWLSDPRRAIAFVLLLDDSVPVTCTTIELRRYFEEVSKRAGVEFFCEIGTDTKTHFQEDELRTGWSRPAPGITPLQSRSETISPRWGINE